MQMEVNVSKSALDGFMAQIGQRARLALQPAPVVTASVAESDLAPSPLPAHNVLAGQPKAQCKTLSISADGELSTALWSCTVGKFRWHHNSDEVVHILSGEVTVTNPQGKDSQLRAGSVAYFPQGTTSVWNVTADVKKLALFRSKPSTLASRVLRRAARLLSI